ncbi:MAG: PQQ-dependent sugar dehydrogenase [Candidatus Freyarchaeum deiterrae]
MGSIGTKSGALKIAVLVTILLTASTVTAALIIQSQNQNSNQTINQAFELNLYFSLFSAPFGVERAFPNLLFDHPVGLYSAGDGSNRLFVIEQPGVIKVFNNSVNTTTAEVFLDIRDQVVYGGEQGLLGLAFHPNFTTNHYFYVDYTAKNDGRTVIARYTVNQTNPDQANRSSEQIILEVPQPFANHNGGQLAFGPSDGYLYIALGDGGSEGDPQGNGQNLSTLLGKILRIDINTATPPLNYSIPPDNPFASNTQNIREEIYAYGFRNPWRFSFDNVTGQQLWAGDVGQNSWEEIDIIQSGRNYGWNIMEGNHIFILPPGFNTGTLTPPIWEYSHLVGDAIMGGFVYRGSELPELNGSYIYGDFGSGRIWALNYDGVNPTNNTLLAHSNLPITAFGVDENNELYIVDYGGGIYQLNSSTSPKEIVSTMLLSTLNPIQQNLQVSQTYLVPALPTIVAQSVKDFSK